SSSRLSAMKIMALTRSAPSSIVMFGRCCKAAAMWREELASSPPLIPKTGVLKSWTRLPAPPAWGRGGWLGRSKRAGPTATGGRVGGGGQGGGAAGQEGPGQVGRLGRHMQAGRHPEARQRLLLLEPLADRPEDRHVPLGPENPTITGLGQSEVLHIRRNDGRQ